MHFLVTGHTGFKGVWLSLLLLELGHQVSGISLEPEENSLFNSINLEKRLMNDIRLDIRNRNLLKDQFSVVQPDILVHLAAQPLVRKGYREPQLTYETNVVGTLNVLSAALEQSSLAAQLIITTDKVYRVDDKKEIFDENSALGGDDPYSASKAMADILTQSWMKTNSDRLISVARAGNVIGGGDICEDRLVPDLVRAFSKGRNPNLRFPDAVRPWQHVLDCINGYLTLINYMLKEKKNGVWNFGPNNEEQVSVRSFAERMASAWGIEIEFNFTEKPEIKETSFLALDSSKARDILNWRNIYSAQEAIVMTTKWYKEVLNGMSPEKMTRSQISDYLSAIS